MFRRTNFLMSVALLLCGALTLSAFAQTMNQTEDFRRQPPPPLASKALNIPKPFETQLASGMQLVVVEDARLPLVSYRLAFRTGNASDPAGLPGLTSMMTNLLTEGTETRTSKQIADEVARLGATLNAGSNSDYTTVAASALAMYKDQILDLLADVTLHPSFPENELQLAKQNTKQALIQQRAQPSFLANERLARIIFGQNPYANISATPESVDAMTRDRIAAFQRAMLVPNNAVLVVAGDVKREDVVKRVNELFGKWNKAELTNTQFPTPPVRTTRAIYVVDRPGSAQSNIVIANTAIARNSPDYFPVLLLHTVLGANPSSRLFMNLREKRGYTYGAYSNLDARRAAGTFRSTAEVRTPVTGDSLKEFFSELDRIRAEAVSEKELKDAKSYLTGVFPIRLETLDGLVDQLVQIKMFGLPADYLQTYRDRVNAVTAADIQRVAQQNITPDKVAVVIVGDASAIMSQIKPYSQNIEVFDMSGKPRDMSMATTPTTTVTSTVSTTTANNAATVLGTWALDISAPGGQLPATLVLMRDGSTFSGTVKSQLGEIPLKNLTINGNAFDASVTFDMQGQTFDGKVSGTADGDTMKGTLILTVEGAPPLSFTGTRSK